MDNTFENNPNLKEYFQTSDGEKFYTKNMAENHARDLKDRSVTTVSRPADKEVKETAADIIAKAPEMDLETAEEYLETENALEKPRKTVVEALEARISELEN
jgi:hypothetical protein